MIFVITVVKICCGLKRHTTFWPLWWQISLSIRVQTTLNHIRFVNFRVFHVNGVFINPSTSNINLCNLLTVFSVFCMALVGRISLDIKTHTFGDDFVYSHFLYVWSSRDIVWRNWLLITIERSYCCSTKKVAKEESLPFLPSLSYIILYFQTSNSLL